MLVALAIGGVGLIVYGFQGACESVLAGFERLDVAAFAKIVNQVVFVFVGAGALLLGSSYHGLVVANLLGACVMAALCWQGLARLSVRPTSPCMSTWPVLLRASAPFAVIAGTLGLSYKLDSVLLNLWWGDAETGYYNAAYALVIASVFFSNSLNTALFPTLTRQMQTSPEILPQIMATALRFLLVVSLPIAIGGWALANEVIALFYGAGFGPSGPVLGILVLVVPLMFVSEFLGYVVVVRGAENRVARSVLISTGVNVVCNLLLVPWLGLTAAAIMTVVTEAILVAQYAIYLRPVLSQVPWGRVFVRPLLAALTMGCTSFVLRDLQVIVTMGISATVYGLLILVLGVIGRDDFRMALEAFAPAQRRLRASSPA
jgi:O-antigen/teichoic acid export membrane protein